MLPLLTDFQISLDPSRFFAAALGAFPDPWQERVLRSASPRIILNCSRQSGKSTTTAALALHQALYHAGSLVLMVAPTLRQSQELFRKLMTAYRQLGRPVVPHAETALGLDLTNGSRIVCLPGDATTIRSYSGVALLIIDEASRVPDDVYIAVRPMVAVSGGSIVLLSTPNGRRGFFHRTWIEGAQTWHREAITADDCPRISPDFLEEERLSLGPWFEQEYFCAFQDSQFQLFAGDAIEAAITDAVTPLWS